LPLRFEPPAPWMRLTQARAAAGHRPEKSGPPRVASRGRRHACAQRALAGLRSHRARGPHHRPRRSRVARPEHVIWSSVRHLLGAASGCGRPIVDKRLDLPNRQFQVVDIEAATGCKKARKRSSQSAVVAPAIGAYLRIETSAGIPNHRRRDRWPSSMTIRRASGMRLARMRPLTTGTSGSSVPAGCFRSGSRTGRDRWE
jgi:hypothetical protein